MKPQPNPRRAEPTITELFVLAYAADKALLLNKAPPGTHNGSLESNLCYNVARSYVKIISKMLGNPGSTRIAQLVGRKIYIVERLLADNGPPRPVRSSSRPFNAAQRSRLLELVKGGAKASEIARDLGLTGLGARVRVYREVQRLVDLGELPSRPLQRRRRGSAGAAVTPD